MNYTASMSINSTIIAIAIIIIINPTFHNYWMLMMNRSPQRPFRYRMPAVTFRPHQVP